jgi:hypothetical protein
MTWMAAQQSSDAVQQHFGRSKMTSQVHGERYKVRCGEG